VFFFTPYNLFIAADPLRHSPGFLSSMSLWHVSRITTHAIKTVLLIDILTK